MAAPDTTQAYWATGKVAANCTNLATAWPHGGVGLGLIGAVELVTGSLFEALIEEETNAPFELLWLGGPVEMVVRIKEWSSDAISRIFPGGSAGANGPLIALLAATIGQAAVVLDNVVFTPEAQSVNAGKPPFVVLRDVVAVPDPDQRVQFSAFKMMEFRARLFATNVSDALGHVGASQDVAL